MSLSGHLERSAPFAIKVMWVCLIAVPCIWQLYGALKLAGMSDSVASSWAQAFGQNAAILGAFYVASWQYRKQQSHAVEQQQQRRSAMRAVVESAVEHAKCIEEFAAKSPDDLTLRAYWGVGLEGTYEAALQAMKAIPVHELGSAERVVQFMAIVGALGKLQALIDQYIRTGVPEQLNGTYDQVIAQAKIVAYSWGRYSACQDV
ncbi:hypothetical protein [Pseudomonas putida]|uniref:hypothetical protein n=1 Tax=Pseudomonas putida TaxID=303 RepID=UPI0012DAD81B|nr:hypothetical protein [Pseudomonas putida]